MLIKCKLKREGGSKIKIGGEEYHFAPDDNGDHVAEVTNKEHANRFLEISEAYEAVGAKKRAKAVQAQAPTEPGNPSGTTGDNSRTGVEDTPVVSAAEINAMGKKELLELAAGNNVPVNGLAPVSTLRKSLIKALGA